MFNLKTEIKNIQYEETIKAMYPYAEKNLLKINSNEPIIEFLKSMGCDILPIIDEILPSIKNETKDALLIQIADMVLKEPNSLIPEEYKEIFSIESVKVYSEYDRIIVAVKGISIDYLKLSENISIKKLLTDKFGELAKIILYASKGLKIFPGAINKLEKKCLQYLLKNKNNIGDQIQELLIKNGIMINFDDYSFPKELIFENNSYNKFEIDKDIQKELFVSFAQYLKKHI